MSSEFRTEAFGKWILVGEHAVLRGAPALVFPLTSKSLQLHFTPTSEPFMLFYEGEAKTHAEEKVNLVLDTAFHLLNISPQGNLHIQNEIPVGTGLGASAALSVAIAKWLKACFEPELDVFNFARELENLLHGQSSGLDIAGSMATDGCVYFQSGVATAMTPTWQPHIKLSYSGTEGNTAHCIEKVASLKARNPKQADAVDKNMQQSVEQAKEALTTQNIHLLAKAMNHAAACFNEWGLISRSLKQHMDNELEKGALAVKPTGSGCGGHIISLWHPETAPQAI